MFALRTERPVVAVALASLVACSAVLLPPAGQKRLGQLISKPLIDRHPRAEIGDPATLTGIVVLGGGVERLREAGRLARLWPHLKVLVSSAGQPDEVWKELGNGIAPSRVAIETFSRNTHENAVNSRTLVAPREGERWLLVTSAIHMPRSLSAFERSGFQAEPWPVYDLARAGSETLQVTTHEWVGIAWYWTRARLATLVPAMAPPAPEEARPIPRSKWSDAASSKTIVLNRL